MTELITKKFVNVLVGNWLNSTLIPPEAHIGNSMLETFGTLHCSLGTWWTYCVAFNVRDAVWHWVQTSWEDAVHSTNLLFLQAPPPGVSTPKLLADEGIPMLDRVTVDSTTLSAYSASVAYSFFFFRPLCHQAKKTVSDTRQWDTFPIGVLSSHTEMCTIHYIKYVLTWEEKSISSPKPTLPNGAVLIQSWAVLNPFRQAPPGPPPSNGSNLWPEKPTSLYPGLGQKQ